MAESKRVILPLSERFTMRQLFVKYSQDKVINFPQLQKLLQEENIYRTKDEATAKAREYIDKYDTDKSGTMDFAEFLQCAGSEIYLLRQKQATERSLLLQRIFNLADKDGSGTLSKAEITELIDPVIHDELEDREYKFIETLDFLETAEDNLKKSVYDTFNGIFELFDKDDSGCISPEELQKAIPIMEDIVRILKRVDRIWNAEGEVTVNKTDSEAPIPSDKQLYVEDAVELFKYYHFHRLEKTMAKRKRDQESAATNDNEEHTATNESEENAETNENEENLATNENEKNAETNENEENVATNEKEAKEDAGAAEENTVAEKNEEN